MNSDVTNAEFSPRGSQLIFRGNEEAVVQVVTSVTCILGQCGSNSGRAGDMRPRFRILVMFFNSSIQMPMFVVDFVRS
jgi:hypothetical protein